MNRLAIFTDAAGKESQASPETTERLAGLSAYWRLDDVVCREFLKLGTSNPADFEAVKLLFPYLRETSVFRTPREWQFVADCQYFAFYAGHDLGCKHPELVESILPGDEVKEGKRRLQILQRCGDGERLNPRGLDRAFKAVAESNRPTKPDVNVDALVCSLILRSARAGFAAGTVALTDPVFAETLDDLGRPVGGHFPVLERAFIAAPWRAFEDGVNSPKHPLLRLTRDLYPENSLEGKTILTFVEEHLKKTGAFREEVCPAGDLDLLDWIAAGLEFGRRLKSEHPELVAAILQECAGKRLKDSRSVIQTVTTKAGRIEPLSLIRPLLEWYRSVHQKEDPQFYGQSLARVGCFADFAVWIQWVQEGEV
jgi:hypothetical protein